MHKEKEQEIASTSKHLMKDDLHNFHKNNLVSF